MNSVLRGIEMSDHPPEMKAQILAHFLPMVHNQIARDPAEVPQLLSLASRWVVSPQAEIFSNAGHKLVVMFATSFPGAFTSEWFDALASSVGNAADPSRYLCSIEAILSLLALVLNSLLKRSDNTLPYDKLCSHIMRTISPLLPVQHKFSPRLRALIACTLSSVLPYIIHCKDVGKSKEFQLHEALMFPLLKVPVQWLNSRAIVSAGALLMQRCQPTISLHHGRSLFVGEIVNLCKVVWACGNASGDVLLQRVMTTTQCTLDTLCGKYDGQTVTPATTNILETDAYAGIPSTDPLSLLVGTLPVSIVPLCSDRLAQSAFSYHSSELECMLRRMSTWEFLQQPHPSAAIGLWFEAVVYAMCASGRYEVLVHVGKQVISNLVKKLTIRNPKTGVRRNGVWGALERLIVGHPDPSVFYSVVPILCDLLDGWRKKPPPAPVGPDEILSTEHDFCARVLALVQVLIALNNNSSNGVSSGGQSIKDMMRELENLWHEVSLATNCCPQSAVQLLQICRRGAWPAAEGTMVVALEHFTNSLKDRTYALATPNSQILTWCSMSVIRPALPLRPGPGLPNLGNTCYMNSVMQTLFHTDAFRELLLRGDGGDIATAKSNPKLLFALKRLFTFMTLSMRRSLIGDPVITHFRSSLRDEVYRGHQQQDAAEFTKYLLNELADTCALQKAVDLYGGELTTKVRCRRCSAVSVSQPERFMELSLSLEKSNHGDGNRLTIETLLEQFHHVEVLKGANRYRCASESCQNQLVDLAERVTHVSKFPSHLVLSLKRFYYDRKTGRVAKLMHDVEFSRELFVSDPEPNAVPGSNVGYSLYGAIMHIGKNASSGHYVAYVTHSSEARFMVDGGGYDSDDSVWWRCDDESVTPLSSGDWLSLGGKWGKRARQSNSSTVYMLLYKRHEEDVIQMDIDKTEDDVSPHLRDEGKEKLRQEGAATCSQSKNKKQVYFQANAMSVPAEMSENCKYDNVQYMLTQVKNNLKLSAK